MKRCTKCHEVKDISEFYFRKATNTFHSWCKSCCLIHNRAAAKKRGRDYRIPRAESTAFVQNLLKRNGIPSCVGYAMNMPGIDLLAWACVPIEAKIARPLRPNYFHWSFTNGQANKLNGFVVCVADFGEYHRHFVIPADELKRERSAFCLTLDSAHGNSRWQRFGGYEDSFSLINEARDLFARGA